MEAEIIVINNDELPLGGIGRQIGSTPNLDFPISVLEINRNIGFGSAHNAGFARSGGEYVLFLNPDTKILPGALRELLDLFAGDQKIGLAGPLLVDSAGRIQPDCFGSHKTPLATVAGKIFSRKRGDPGQDGVFETDWVSGGALLARREVFEKTGGFDERYFMYFEDVDLCLRAKKFGYKVAVNPAARIFHESGQSFANEREKKKYYYASQDHYMRKHFGSVAAWVMKIVRLPYYMKNVYLNR